MIKYGADNFNHKLEGKTEEITWSKARTYLKNIDPILTKIIDELNPGKEFKLFKVSYPFGATIADNGEFFMPNYDGHIVPLCSEEMPEGIKSHLKRRDIPVAMVLKNNAEIYKALPTRVISRFVISPGGLFGLWGNLEQESISYVKWTWTLVSGARSLYMLPKISDVLSHKRLRKNYNIFSHAPKDNLDHWKIFVELANSEDFNQEWHTEWLFFSDKWFDTAISDPAWREFYVYMFERAWQETAYWRDTGTDLTWEWFFYEVLHDNIRPNIYLFCILKQLILIGLGILPCHEVADNQDRCGPISKIQNIYLHCYKIKRFIPTIMQPHQFSLQDLYPSYYSLQYPNLLESIPFLANVPSILNAMPDIMHLLQMFQQKTIDNKIKKETPIDTFLKNSSINFCHTTREYYNNIQATTILPNFDDRLTKYPLNCRNKEFACASAFLKGCIVFANASRWVKK